MGRVSHHIHRACLYSAGGDDMGHKQKDSGMLGTISETGILQCPSHVSAVYRTVFAALACCVKQPQSPECASTTVPLEREQYFLRGTNH